jgi:ABC-type transport system involved in multi-copper enzyme maturation permease subunit
MIRLTLRQFRTQAYVAIGLLIVAAALLGATGPHFAHLYNGYAKAQADCFASSSCGRVDIKIGTFYQLLELIGTALVAVPGLVGAFWGAPLITREFENGTQRLAWTQSVTRTRWIAIKLALVGGASVAATGLLSLMVTWWSNAMDRANGNQFGNGLFGERNIVPLGYAAFGFALGVTFGVLIRRTLPAMAATLAVFLGVRLAFTYLVRPHLMSPRHLTASLSAVTQGYGSSNGGPTTLQFGASNQPGAWVYSTQAVDSSGHALTASIVSNTCPTLSQGLTAPAPVTSESTAAVAPPSATDPLHACVTKLSSTYHGVITYQPASRYWIFQVLETGIFLAAALALAGFCFYVLRRRDRHPGRRR